MSHCEMCGTETEELFETNIAGATLEVCDECTTCGTVLEEPPEENEKSKETPEEQGNAPEENVTNKTPDTLQDPIMAKRKKRDSKQNSETNIQAKELVYDYDERIRKSREQQDISQEELANRIGETTSLIQELENGQAMPEENVRRKLETELEVTLEELGGGRRGD